MANWIKQVNGTTRLSDKQCVELSIGRSKVFFNVDDLDEVIRMGEILQTYMATPEGQAFYNEAHKSNETRKAQEYLDKQVKHQAAKEIKALTAQKESLSRKFGPSAAPLVAQIDAQIVNLMLKAS